ncbi:MAG: hypothetical protein JKY67_08375 [Pseudomonadales bacterium]|nr:hypothetical protein [Pseudomonadales bacterium]
MFNDDQITIKTSRQFFNKSQIIALGLGIALLGLHVFFLKPYHLFAAGIDDSYISYHYAQNLFNGYGFRFNADGERVEGFTSFLWVINLAAAQSLGFDLTKAGPTLGICYTVITLIILLYWINALGGTRSNLMSSSIIMMSSPLVAYWAASGMDTSLFSMLLTLSVCMATIKPLNNKSACLLGTILILTGMARPEGVMIAIILFMCLFIAALREKSPIKPVIIAVSTFVLLGAIYFSWRVNYFGYWLPNTFYAKVSSNPRQVLTGVRFIYEYALANGQFLLAMPLLLVFRHFRHSIHTVLAILGFYFIYLIVEGGDTLSHPYFRYISPLWPLFTLLMVQFLDVCSSTSEAYIDPSKHTSIALKQTAISAFVVFLCAFWFFRPSLTNASSRFNDSWGTYRNEQQLIKVAAWFNRNSKEGETMAVTLAGIFPYYTGLHTIDMLGLNDTIIAHMKAPNMGTGQKGHERSFPKEVLRRKPTYVILKRPLTNQPIQSTDYTNAIDAIRDVYLEESFHTDYEHRSIKIEDKYFNFYQRRQGH